MTAVSGAHVLVLGATGGLGSAISRRLVRSGARVWLSGRSAERLRLLADELGDAVVGTTHADLTVPDAPREVVETAARTAPLDGVVFAAGVVAFGPVADLDDDVLDELLLVNLIAPVRVTRAAAGVLGPGSFVALLSAVVAERPTAGMAAYSASKAALTAFDAAAAIELRRKGIQVIDVRPPHTETGLADRPIAGDAPRLGTGLAPDDVAERVVRAITDDEKALPAAAF